MKNLLTVVMLFVFSTALYAQKDVTKFLGIPVDGTKTAMIQKLKAKGFTPSIWDKNILEGEFNGFDVNVHIATNNNKVWRIMLADKNTLDETGIKIRFNKLCRQFENNKKYEPMTDKEQTIPDDEDLSYEMTVNNKRYEAVFYQISPLNRNNLCWTNIHKNNWTIRQKKYQLQSDLIIAIIDWILGCKTYLL